MGVNPRRSRAGAGTPALAAGAGAGAADDAAAMGMGASPTCGAPLKASSSVGVGAHNVPFVARGLPKRGLAGWGGSSRLLMAASLLICLRPDPSRGDSTLSVCFGCSFDGTAVGSRSFSKRSARYLGCAVPAAGGGRLSWAARGRGECCVNEKPPPVRKVGVQPGPALSGVHPRSSCRILAGSRSALCSIDRLRYVEPTFAVCSQTSESRMGTE